jgi:N-acetylglutamate synthase-like GNAT family acetyltransferase
MAAEGSDLVKVRELRPGDETVLERFDLGPSQERWIVEVREIVAGLTGWENDPDSAPLDREVLVLEDDGVIVGVAAHEATRTASGVINRQDRYLMVTAVVADRQRSGLATLLVNSTIDDIRDRGGRTVTWLVHPSNAASVWFSRTAFPEADQTSPPEDRPYLSYTLTIADLA